MKKIYTLDGKNIHDLDSFFSEFAKMVNAPNGYFGRDLMQFDDCLFGGYGLEAPCEIIWKSSNISKQRLDSEVLKEYYESYKIYYEEQLTIEIQELYDGGRKDAKEEDCFYYDMLSISKDLIEKAESGEISMFDELIHKIQSVTKRARFDWVVDLRLE